MSSTRRTTQGYAVSRLGRPAALSVAAEVAGQGPRHIVVVDPTRVLRHVGGPPRGQGRTGSVGIGPVNPDVVG